MITFRFAKKDDNLKDIAGLIYDTDPFIYPCWFDDDRDKAVSRLSKLLTKKGLYNYQNFFVAVSNGKIVGIVMFITADKASYKHPLLMHGLKNYNRVYNEYVGHITDGLADDELHIVCVCVNARYRRNKIGSKLLENFFESYKNDSINHYVLYCLKDNPPANHLYTKLGFEKVEDCIGFSKNQIDVIDVIKYKKKIK